MPALWWGRPLHLLMPESAQISGSTVTLGILLSPRNNLSPGNLQVQIQATLCLSTLGCAPQPQCSRLCLKWYIPHQTVPLSLLLFGNLGESISFYLISSPSAPHVLGYPWLCQHSQLIVWATGKVSGWRCECHARLCHRSPGGGTLTF